jgi:hypothetical protein
MTTGIVRSRHTIRKNPPSNRVPVYVEPWTFAEDAKHLAPIEKAFRDALEVVDLTNELTEAPKARIVSFPTRPASSNGSGSFKASP